jgi:glyoxylase-like metal-dependent hydrolase (beta-lactamase superfamily II)
MEHFKKLENITIFWGKHRGPLIYSNTFVVEVDKKRPVIIDPGSESPELKKLAEQEGFVVNTHFHGDHRRMNYLFKKSEFFAPEPDAPMIESHERFIDAVGITDKTLREQWLNVVKTIYNITEHRITGTFRDNEYIIDKAYGLKAVALPGHTQGHSGIFFESAALVLITDIDLTPFGPWYGNQVSDIDAFLESIEKVKHIDAKYFITSHSTEIYTREQLLPLLERFASHIERRDRAILKLLESNPSLSLDELATFGIIYPKSSLINNPALVFFEKKMLEKHLERQKIQLKATG